MRSSVSCKGVTGRENAQQLAADESTRRVMRHDNRQGFSTDMPFLENLLNSQPDLPGNARTQTNCSVLVGKGPI
eukprot:8566428-Pyramimonas_sp.AAC.1